MAHTLPELPYGYDALEPVIDTKTMELHYRKHHQGYVDKLNAALEGNDELAAKPVEELLREIDQVPDDIRQAVINNGGGHANHTLFWQVMTPGGSELPSGEFADALTEAFGGVGELRAALSDAATTRFGSGWAWLVIGEDRLEVMSTANQESPLMTGKTPLLGIDVWEHAYYLKYQNRRPEYVEAWWDLVHWQEVAQRYDAVR